MENQSLANSEEVEMTCPKIEYCNKEKTHDFFRLTCMGDPKICHAFDGAIDLGSENRHPRDWVVGEHDPTKWWLISDEDVQAIRKGLTGSLLHILSSGLHTTDEIPDDWKPQRSTPKPIE